jgi:hypothetical protein
MQQFLYVVFLTEFHKFFLDFVYKSVVAVAFQSVFHLEIHQNNIFFYFLKIIFDISVSK